MSGSLLLSHTVSSAVPSAVQALTFVFGMRTGVSPERIATGYSFVIFELSRRFSYKRFIRKYSLKISFASTSAL